MASLSGKCAVVTGSVSGLGYAIAQSLAEDGASVVVNGLVTQEDGERAANQLRERTGASVHFDAADLRDVAAIHAMMHGAAERFGGVDIVVNNAVVRHFKKIEDFTPLDWDTSIAVNLSAAFHCVRLALPGMRARNWGRIINLSSIYGFRGANHRVDYVTTKTALIGLTRAVAIETATTGITCNAIAPGTLPSPAILERIAGIAASEGIDVQEAEREYLTSRNPTQRFIALENVGRLVAFLCSPGGADINGATLPMDGGWHVA